MSHHFDCETLSVKSSVTLWWCTYRWYSKQVNSCTTGHMLLFCLLMLLSWHDPAKPENPINDFCSVNSAASISCGSLLFKLDKLSCYQTSFTFGIWSKVRLKHLYAIHFTRHWLSSDNNFTLCHLLSSLQPDPTPSVLYPQPTIATAEQWLCAYSWKWTLKA